MASNRGKLATFNIVWTGSIIFIFLLIAGINAFNMGRVGVNKTVAGTYAVMAVVGGFAMLVFAVMNWIKKKIPEHYRVGFVSETGKEFPLGFSLFSKFGTHFVWFVIVLLMSFSGIQIWGEPDYYSGISEFSTGGEAFSQLSIEAGVWNIGVNPAFGEDGVAMAISAGLIVMIMILIFGLFAFTKSPIFRPFPFWYWFSVIFSCFSASVIFSKAHEIVAGSNLPFYFSAWFFQSLNLLVFWSTGLFFPVHHFAHNMVYFLGFAVAFSVAFIVVPFFRKKIKNNKEVGKI